VLERSDKKTSGNIKESTHLDRSGEAHEKDGKPQVSVQVKVDTNQSNKVHQGVVKVKADAGKFVLGLEKEEAEDPPFSLGY